MDTIEEPMDSFQSRLRTAMQMRNMSVSTLSSKSGISQNTIYIYLNPEIIGNRVRDRIISKLWPWRLTSQWTGCGADRWR